MTEKEISSYPHKVVNGYYLFASIKNEDAMPVNPVRPITFTGECPYCGAHWTSWHKGQARPTEGGWTWGVYECGTAWAAADELLGVSKPSTECIYRSAIDNIMDDVI